MNRDDVFKALELSENRNGCVIANYTKYEQSELEHRDLLLNFYLLVVQIIKDAITVSGFKTEYTKDSEPAKYYNLYDCFDIDVRRGIPNSKRYPKEHLCMWEANIVIDILFNRNRIFRVHHHGTEIEIKDFHYGSWVDTLHSMAEIRRIRFEVPSNYYKKSEKTRNFYFRFALIKEHSSHNSED